MHETFISVGLTVVHMCTSLYIFTFLACSLLAGSVPSFFTQTSVVYNLQSKVKNLCTAYKFLLRTHRDGFLKALACDHAVDHPMVCKAAKSLLYIEVRCLYNDEFNMSVSLCLTSTKLNVDLWVEGLFCAVIKSIMW